MVTPKQDLKRKVILNAAYADYAKGLNLYSFFKMHDKALSEDLVQETFMKTWRYLAKGGKVGLMKAFLYHILNDLIIDEYRKHKTVSLNALLDKGYDPPAGHPDHNFNSLDGKAAMLLIAKLPEKYRKVVHMRYVRDLSLGEMSLITGQSKNSIAVQVHRGLEKLKVLYEPDEQE